MDLQIEHKLDLTIAHGTGLETTHGIDVKIKHRVRGFPVSKAIALYFTSSSSPNLALEHINYNKVFG